MNNKQVAVICAALTCGFAAVAAAILKSNIKTDVDTVTKSFLGLLESLEFKL